MITLIKFRPAFGLTDPSPFCVKAELLLKMAGLDYRKEEGFSPGRGPKGKLPAIRDDGVTIGDSEFIRRHLETRYGVDFDRGLGPLERARAHAYARMLEERTYWCAVYGRWIEPANWPVVRDTLFAGLPGPIRAPLGVVIQRQVRANLRRQGTGRHSAAEIYALGARDIEALASELGDKPFMMGAAPTGLDATAYAFVSGIIDPPLPTPLVDAARRCANLVAYAGRMKARFFGLPATSASSG